jgi:hypothetical protein
MMSKKIISTAGNGSSYSKTWCSSGTVSLAEGVIKIVHTQLDIRKPKATDPSDSEQGNTNSNRSKE